jgi:nucleotide-binding universal stress UspA family protein
MHTTCQLVHAVERRWTIGEPSFDERYDRERDVTQHALWGDVPVRALERMSIRAGRAPVALRQAAAEVDAGLIVLGAKHHPTLSEWAGRAVPRCT